ncbi:MAG: hypothetical protein HZB70_01640 [Candidatus Berkelbacteria bacterium]|nr:MAG: hypothetical protein HZB70_01640 [Candidatus Berkelbacteria bacterium]QQG52161.1 MAG: hypothetical protein HY845_01355 [Candidatus Berkelbacteria bacterium]
MMGMNADMMSGGLGGGMMVFGWLLYLLFVVALVLSAIALGKYIGKN